MSTKIEQRTARALILNYLDKIIEGYPDITVAQHIKGIFRSKGKSDKDVYFWNNSEVLECLKNYYEELENNPPQFWETDIDDL